MFNKKNKEDWLTKVFRFKDKFKDRFIEANNEFDKKIINAKAIGFYSFIITILIVFSLYFTNANFSSLLSTQSTSVLRDIPINFIYDQKNKIIKSETQAVTATLSGNKNLIDKSINSKSFNIFVEINEDEIGELNKEVNYKGIDDSIDVNLSNKFINIEVSKKESKKFKLDYIFINKEKIKPEISLEHPSLKQKEVRLSGSKEDLNQVDNVVALIDLSKEINSNNIIFDNSNLIAYDKNGNKLDIDIDPKNIQTKTKVSNYKKTVIINPIFKNKDKNIKIDSYKLSQEKVEIFGLEEKIKDIKSLELIIDLKNKQKSFKKKIKIKQPSEVNLIKPSEIEIKVNLK